MAKRGIHVSLPLCACADSLTLLERPLANSRVNSATFLPALLGVAMVIVVPREVNQGEVDLLTRLTSYQPWASLWSAGSLFCGHAGDVTVIVPHLNVLTLITALLDSRNWKTIVFLYMPRRLRGYFLTKDVILCCWFKRSDNYVLEDEDSCSKFFDLGIQSIKYTQQSLERYYQLVNNKKSDVIFVNLYTMYCRDGQHLNFYLHLKSDTFIARINYLNLQ